MEKQRSNDGGVANPTRGHDTLSACNTKGSPVERAVEIFRGYRTGIVGRMAEMHARFYARTAGFGRMFECKVASEAAEFAGRLDNPANELWSASVGGSIVGTVAVDGEDLDKRVAHLRWFMVEDGLRGAGIGRKLLAEAIAFCDARNFAETHLWTFEGLVAARRLYEASGFVLVEQRPGCQWGKEVVEQRFVRTAAEMPR